MFAIVWLVISALIALLIVSEDTQRSIKPFWRIVFIFFWPFVAVAAILFVCFAIFMGVLDWMLGND